jgi:acyl-CoA hydrolase
MIEPFESAQMKKLNYTSAQEAVSIVKNGNRVFLHGSAATPIQLVRALLERSGELKNVELLGISSYGDDLFNHPKFGESFFINALFVSANMRNHVNSANGDYIPVFLSEIPLLFRRGLLQLDVAFLHVSPPDKHGYCSLGVSVDVALAAMQCAKHVIAQVNPNMPRTLGDGLVHVSKIDAFVACYDALPEVSYQHKINEVSIQIGKNCAALIEDRSCLQMGIGNIPDAVLNCLTNHKDLGIHTEMFSDGVLNLVDLGVITNKYKAKHRGKIVTGFAVGTRRLYDFVDDNPQVSFLDIAYVNDASIIRQNPKAVSVNSAIEIDITGQVCADSIGIYQFSGVGGQMDFMRGASLSEGGKPIIALSSTTKNGESKIVPMLKPGAAVVTTRAHVHHVVTEFGVANLYGKNLAQRAKSLIEIAHPSHREMLSKAVFERFGV